MTVSEGAKSLSSVQQIWDFLLAKGITRRGLLICVGGGVLTDIGGFAAATYKRGIDYVNIPTTLLAMVDASIGGKTGFNYGGLKNSIGCFAMPVATLIDPKWLATLPPQEFLSGFAEMLKMGLVNVRRDNVQCTEERTLWDALNAYDLETMPLDTLAPLIERSIEAKKRIVEADPHEVGLRKVLNFGHTFGHALEEIQMVNGKSSNGKWLHGYAVLYGMIAELYLSVTKLGCPKEPLQQLTQQMIHYYGKPVCKCSDRSQLIQLMQQDKKNERAAEINCTLIQDIGSPVINQLIRPDEAEEALEYLFSL
jgi:3-dehydroquinate synthase